MRAIRQYGPPLAIYGATRLLAALFVVLAAPGRVIHLESLPLYHAVSQHLLPPDYATVMTSWDGQWYWDIAENGYPSSARGSDGQPTMTSLAFFPLYPTLVRVGMHLTGLGFEVVAPTLSLLLGGAAVLMVYRLVEQALDRRSALACTAILCCFASAPILQAAYTESLALLLVAATLHLLLRQRYGWAMLTIVLLALTRNVAAVFAPVVALHWWGRWRVSRRFPHAEIPHLRLGILVFGSMAATAAWPITAGLITGEPDAYFATMKAWPGYTGSPLDPPWLDAALRAGPRGWAIAAGLALVFFLVVAGRSQRAWGPELWGWTVSYSLYVFLATGFTSSVIRYMLLNFPLALVLMPSRSDDPQWERRSARIVALSCALGILLQAVWIRQILVNVGDRGGWGYP
jgi:hypothetical protein